MTAINGLYAITPDTDDTERLLEQVEPVLSQGVRILQYRNKSRNAALRLWQAGLLADACHRHHVLFIINDDVELAYMIKADGVHVGRNDVAIISARSTLGPTAIIGASCYNQLDLAKQAVSAGASYVAFGAVFPSSTKPDAVQAPLSLFAEATHLGVPTVAIGGITADNAGQVIAAGAHAVAVIGGLFEQDNPAEAAHRIASLFPLH